MIVSKSAEYAIRALIYLRANTGIVKNIDEVASVTNAPRPLLAKILQLLVTKNLLLSKKGPGGGFYLSNESKSLTIGDIHSVFNQKKCK